MMKRSTTMDVAKGIAMLMVILGHIGVGIVGTYFYTFHLPLFFVVTGYFWKEEAFGTFLKKKALGILVPYVFFALLLAGFETLTVWHSFEKFLTLLHDFLVQRRFTTLWYLAALFWGCVFYELLRRICRNRFYIQGILCIILSMAGIVYLQVWKSPLPWNIETGCICLSFMWTGQYLKKRDFIRRLDEQAWKKKLLCVIVPSLGGIILSLLNYYLSGETLNMWDGTYGNGPLTIMAAILGSIGIFALASLWGKSKMLAYTGANSITFLALQNNIGLYLALTLWGKLGVQEMTTPVKVLQKLLFFIFIYLLCAGIHQIIIWLHLGILLGKRKMKK